jgi:hypothetical protein
VMNLTKFAPHASGDLLVKQISTLDQQCGRDGQAVMPGFVAGCVHAWTGVSHAYYIAAAMNEPPAAPAMPVVRPVSAGQRSFCEI